MATKEELESKLDKNYIELPLGPINLMAMSKPKCMKELKEENIYYHELIESFYADDFVVMSDATGEEIQDHLGEFCIWYKYSNKIKCQKIFTYKDIRYSDLTTKQFSDILLYLIRYYGLFYGKVIHITYSQDGVYWKLKCERKWREKYIDPNLTCKISQIPIKYWHDSYANTYIGSIWMGYGNSSGAACMAINIPTDIRDTSICPNNFD